MVIFRGLAYQDLRTIANIAAVAANTHDGRTIPAHKHCAAMLAAGLPAAAGKPGLESAKGFHPPEQLAIDDHCG